MQYMLLGITKRRQEKKKMIEINARLLHYSGSAYSGLGREVVELVAAVVVVVVHYSKMVCSKTTVVVGLCRTPTGSRAVDVPLVRGSSF